MDPLEDFLSKVMADRTVREHIQWAMAQWEKDPGQVHGTYVNALEILWEWEGGDVAMVTEGALEILHAHSDDHRLPWDFCVLAVLESDRDEDHPDGHMDYLIRRIDPEDITAFTPIAS